MRKQFHTIITSFLIASVTTINTAAACSRILLIDKSNAVMVGRTMDWFEDLQTNLIVYPEGIVREGIVSDNPIHWTAKYGSMVATAYNNISTDGMNEAGLGMHLLSLPESNYGERNTQIPGMSVIQWGQFYLDNFANVAEAVKFSESKSSYQLVPYFEPHLKKYVNLHMALDDANGDSAILEFVDGELHIYHDANYTMLTNSPTYDKQLLNLQQYAGFGGDKPLPGTITPADRFVRGSYYVTHLPASSSTKDELLQLMSVVYNVQAPYSTPNTSLPYFSASIWNSVVDLTHRNYYFHSSMGLGTISASLAKFKLLPGSPVMKLDLVNQPDLHGDVSSAFKPIDDYKSV